MKNKRGFTLIELLAVIVILAILVLLAMPAVTSIMESSARNTFKNEILGVVKTMESAYTEKWGNGDIVSDFDDDAKIHTVTKDDKTYSYLCMSLKQLYEEQYIKKNLGENYGGYIQMYVGENDTYTYINTTNGTYYMQGEYDALSASTYEPSKSNNGKEVSKSTTCPSDENDLDTPGTGGNTGGESGGTPTGDTSKLAVNVIKKLVEGADDSSTAAIGTTGLAYDGTADNNLRYIGNYPEPDNSVYYNCSTTNVEEMNEETCELWQIIGVMNNIKTSGGQTKSLLKIRRVESLDYYYSWDTSSNEINEGNGINQWGSSTYKDGTTYEGADLMRELNTDYLGKTQQAVGDKWYSGAKNRQYADKPSSILNANAQAMIEEVEWNLGSPNNNNGTYVEYDSSLLTAPYIYTHERAETNGKICASGTNCNDTVNRTSKWTGKVGLFYPSDYLYATSGGNTTSREACLNEVLDNWSDSSVSDCKKHDWLYHPYEYQWTLSPYTDPSSAAVAYSVGDVTTNGYVGDSDTCIQYSVKPVVFLKSEVKIIGGTGSYENPYILSIN